MSEPPHTTDSGPGRPAALLELYDEAVADVYGYLYRRCSSPALAEDLTSETFLAAAAAVGRGTAPALSVGWLITVARNKLVDHWRRAEREQRALSLLTDEGGEAAGPTGDPCDVVLERDAAQATLARLAPQHRSALTLRYLDGLSVPETAACLGRTVGATEVLLVRARRRFRHLYETLCAGGEEG